MHVFWPNGWIIGFGWIRMSLGTEVDLGPGNIVLDGNSAPPRKGAQQPPLFGPCLLWRNGDELLLHSSRQRVAIYFTMSVKTRLSRDYENNRFISIIFYNKHSNVYVSVGRPILQQYRTSADSGRLLETMSCVNAYQLPADVFLSIRPLLTRRRHASGP